MEGVFGQKMEGFQKFFAELSRDSKSWLSSFSSLSSSSSSSAPSIPDSVNEKVGLAVALPSSSSSSDNSTALITRPPRQAVSLLTCSKLCAIFFVAGVFVGFTLKRRLRNWASRFLRRLKDD